MVNAQEQQRFQNIVKGLGINIGQGTGLFDYSTVFNALATEQPTIYDTQVLDLGTARTNFKIERQGNYFAVAAISDGASLTTKFNSMTNAPLTFDNVQAHYILFKELYITNTAQTGKTVTLYFGLNSFYLPYQLVKIIPSNQKGSLTASVSVTAVESSIDFTADDHTSIVLFNNEMANIIYYGFSAGVTLMPLPPQNSLEFTNSVFRGTIYLLSPSGASDLRYAVYKTL